MIGTFVYFAAVSTIVGFLASRANGWDASYMRVFVICFLASALAYCTMNLPNALFLMSPRRRMLTNLVDGLVFASLTAGSFAGLWPDANPALG